MSGPESTVDISGPQSKDEAYATYGTQGGTRLDVVTDSIPKFTELTYDAFRVEYNLTGNDVVIHFFVPKQRKVTEEFWKVHFAEALNEVGQSHFQATAPRLVAKYTEMVESWWFRAQGYGHVLDLDAYLCRFFEKLEERMAPSLQTQSKIV